MIRDLRARPRFTSPLAVLLSCAASVAAAQSPPTPVAGTAAGATGSLPPMPAFPAPPGAWEAARASAALGQAPGTPVDPEASIAHRAFSWFRTVAKGSSYSMLETFQRNFKRDPGDRTAFIGKVRQLVEEEDLASRQAWGSLCARRAELTTVESWAEAHKEMVAELDTGMVQRLRGFLATFPPSDQEPVKNPLGGPEISFASGKEFRLQPDYPRMFAERDRDCMPGA